MKRLYLIVAMGFLIIGCASKPKVHYTQRLDSEKTIELSKVISIETKQSSMMFIGNIDTDSLASQADVSAYIGIEPISFLAQLAVHSAVIENDKNKLRAGLQDEANQVLVPLEEGIHQVQIDALNQLALNVLTANYPEHNFTTHNDKADYFMVSQPVFVVVDDASQVIVKNIVSVYQRGVSEKPLYQNMIEVMTAKTTGEDKMGVWQANNFAYFVEETKRIFEQSILLAAKDIQNALPKAKDEKTLKFFEGTKHHYERVKIIENRCDYILYRNLRGWLKLAPVTGCVATEEKSLKQQT